MSLKKKIITGVTLTGISTLAIHMINKYIYYSATLDNLLSNPSGTYFDWKFGKIYYKKTGKGHPLLLIHDLTTYSSGHEWNKVLKELSKTNTVYRIDLLGCGRSDKPNLTYTNYLYVQLINDFIKQVIGEQTDILATGKSGAFAVSACQNDSSIIRKIILVNPSDIKALARIPNKRSKMIAHFMNLPIFGTFYYNMLTKRKDIEKLFVDSYYYDKNKIEEETVKTYYEAAHMGKGFSKYLEASIIGRYTTVNLTHCLKSLTNSIYLITGENNIEICKKYEGILPSIESVLIKDTKHLPQLEKNKEFIEQIIIFLSDEY